MRPQYKIYPSMLDAFQRMIDVDYDAFFWQDENGAWHRNYDESSGEYHYSPSEVDDLAKKEFVNFVNRIREVSEAASKGTAFNVLVDALINNEKSEDVETSRVYDEIGRVCAIDAKIDGFTFCFDLQLLKDVACYFKGSLSQVYTSSMIETKYGYVELYGYIDELRKNKVYDIKTTKQYTFGNYKKYWQRHVYPYCLVESAECTNIDMFEFYVVQLKGGTSRTPVISGQIYKEEYSYNHEKSKELIKQQCERLIEFLEANKELITDKKVFNNEC